VSDNKKRTPCTCSNRSDEIRTDRFLGYLTTPFQLHKLQHIASTGRIIGSDKLEKMTKEVVVPYLKADVFCISAFGAMG
jgi:hypothetical protein